jgi:hypothetical protein
MSFESQEIQSVDGESATPGFKDTRKTTKGGKMIHKRMNSDMFDDAKADDTRIVDPNDINFSADGHDDSHMGLNKLSLFESSNDEGSSESGNHSQSQQLVNFKK